MIIAANNIMHSGGCMIRISFFENGTRETDLSFLANVEKTPKNVLGTAYRNGLHWEIDYSHANQNDLSQWLPLDIFFRAQLAERERRPMGLDNAVFGLAEQLVSAVASTDKLVKIASDTNDGFFLETC